LRKSGGGSATIRRAFFARKRAPQSQDRRTVMSRTLRISLRLLAAAFWGVLAMAGTAFAGDPLSALPMVNPSTLGSTVTGNVFNLSIPTSTAAISGTSITAGYGSQIVNGAIANNNIANNSGLTAVMMNTGNNVNFQNSMILNIIASH
jgi:hypothetical protein